MGICGASAGLCFISECVSDLVYISTIRYISSAVGGFWSDMQPDKPEKYNKRFEAANCVSKYYFTLCSLDHPLTHSAKLWADTMQPLAFIKVGLGCYIKEIVHTMYRSRAHVRVRLSEELEMSFLFEKTSSRVFKYPMSYLDHESTENETAVFGQPRGGVPSLVRPLSVIMTLRVISFEYLRGTSLYDFTEKGRHQHPQCLLQSKTSLQRSWRSSSPTLIRSTISKSNCSPRASPSGLPLSSNGRT